jgi:hypothetical protein
MTPYEIDCERERRDQEQGEIASEWYLNGQTDASFGDLPRWTNQAYLAGYVAKLHELPRNEDGTIQYFNYGRNFAFGFVDSPDDCTCDEF